LSSDKQPERAQRFGRFLLQRRIALGGMAEIWLAIDSTQPRNDWIVVKRILPHYAQSSEFVAFFLNEGSIAVRLHHPNIVATYELGQIDDQYFLTMEYVRGDTLLQVLRRAGKRAHRLPLGFAVDVVRGAAGGLGYAHAACDRQGQPLGIVHRDVSPHNLLLGWNGAVKLTDFGIAKASTQLHHTKTGTIKGKLAYVAPEQIRGGQVDARTDVFALGIVLHETITGRPLFKASSEAETLARVMNCVVPSLHEVRPDCPPELDRIALRALAHDREDRYQSAEEMVEDLSHVRAFLGDPEDVVRRQLAELFADEIAHQDPSPTGSWRGEVVAGPPPPPRRGLAGWLGRVAVAATVIAAIVAAEQRSPRPQAIAGVTAPSEEVTSAPPPLQLTRQPAAPPSGRARPDPRPHASSARHAGAGGQVDPAPAGSGRVRLIVQPWAEVLVDGRSAGVTPLSPLALPAGAHTLVLRNPELGREVKRHVVVPADGEATVRVSLFGRRDQ